MRTTLPRLRNRLPELPVGRSVRQSAARALAALLCLLVQLAWAAAPTAATPVSAAAEEVEKVATSPVVVDGATLFAVRGAASLPSQQRAAGIAERIAQAAADPRVDPLQLKVVDEGMASAITAGDLRLMNIVDADSRLEGVEREILSRLYLERIRKSIQAYRHERSPDYLWGSGLRVLAASGLLLAGILALRWLYRRGHAAIERIAKQRMEALEAKTFSLVRAQQLWRLLRAAMGLAWWVAVFLVVDAYLTYALGLFPWTRVFAEILTNTLIPPLQAMVDGMAAALPGLVFIVLLVIVLRYVLGLVKLFFTGVADGSIRWQGVEPEWALPSYRLIRLLTIAFGLVMAYPYIPGSSSEAFKGLSLMLGLLVSLGASSIIGNIMAGYSLIYRRAFKVGDRIKVGDHVGDVTEMGALVTHLRSPKNELVVVPNSEILSSSIVNYSALRKQEGLVLHTTVGIGYATPWRQVEAMLLMAAARTPGLLKAPPPFVLQKSLGDFCVVYEINAHCDTPELMGQLYTALHQNILDVFNEYGVQIMTPAYEGDPDAPKVVPKGAWHAAPAQPPSAGPD